MAREDIRQKRQETQAKTETISLPGKRTGWIRKRNNVWEADYRLNDGRRRKKCSRKWIKDDAIAWLRAEALRLQNQGNAALQLNDKQRTDAVKAYDLLKGTGASLEQAAGYYAKHRAPNLESRTIKEVVVEYITDGEQNELRPRSLRELGYITDRLVTKFGNKKITELDHNTAQNWLNSRKDVSRGTRNKDRVICCGLFNFAISRGYTLDNPFAHKGSGRKLRKEMAAPESFKWQDAEKIMTAAVKHEPSMVPALAIGLFAGLRVAEVRAINWENIDIIAKRIHVPSEIAKSRRERHVAIEDNLLQWLTPCRRDGGPIAPDGEKWRSRLDNVVEKAGVKWIHNGMRHSFASYHVAKYQDSAKTAFQLGHGRDTDMLEEHYKHLRTSEEAEKYWNIKPQTPG